MVLLPLSVRSTPSSRAHRPAHVCLLVALVLYEHMTTFSDEVSTIWSRKLSSVKMLFLCNRYLLLALAILACVPLASSERCLALVTTRSGSGY